MIIDIDHEVYPCIIMDLLVKTLIMPPKIIFNIKRLPRNLKRRLGFSFTVKYLAQNNLVVQVKVLLLRYWSIKPTWNK